VTVAQPIRRNLLFAGAAAGIFVFGTVVAILGTVFGLPEMHLRLRIDLAEQGTIFLVLYLGIFLSTAVVGPLIDAIGNKLVLAVSSALVAAAMAGFSFAHSFWGAALAAFLLGCGGGGLNTSTTALVSDVFGDNRGPMLNLLGVFFGVGALCVPLLAAAIEGRVTIPQLLFSCAALAAVCALVFAAMTFPPAGSPHGFSLREAAKVARYPGVMLLAVLLFCQSGNEASIGGWTSTYAGSAHLGPRVATLVLAAYWAALMGGRLLAARLLGMIGKPQMVLGSAIGAVVGAVVLLLAQSLTSFVAGTALIGLSYAGIFPTVLAIAGDSYRKMAGTVFGLLFSIALLGGMSFPWAVGQLSQRMGVRLGMLVPLFGAAAICVLAGTLWRNEKRNATSTEG
jgi:fucose permease